jgi:hypothetical protein
VDLVGLKFDALPIVGPHEWIMLLFMLQKTDKCIRIAMSMVTKEGWAIVHAKM